MFALFLQIQRNTITSMTVSKQESFLTYFSKANDNLFHSQTIGVIWQALLGKMVRHVIPSLISRRTGGVFHSNIESL